MNQFESIDPMETRRNDIVPEHMIDQPLEQSETHETFRSLRDLFEKVKGAFAAKTDTEKENSLAQLSGRLQDFGRNVTILQREGRQQGDVEEQQSLIEEIREFIKTHQQ